VNVDRASGGGGIDLVAAFTGAPASDAVLPETHRDEEADPEKGSISVEASFQEWLAGATQPEVVPVASIVSDGETPVQVASVVPDGETPARIVSLELDGEIPTHIAAPPSEDARPGESIAIRFEGAPAIETERSTGASPSLEKQFGERSPLRRADTTVPGWLMDSSKHDLDGRVRQTPERMTIPEDAARPAEARIESGRFPSFPGMPQDARSTEGTQVPRGALHAIGTAPALEENGSESEAEIELVDAGAPADAGDPAPAQVMVEETVASDASSRRHDETPSRRPDANPGNSASAGWGNASESIEGTPAKPEAPLHATAPHESSARAADARPHPSIAPGPPLAMSAMRDGLHPSPASSAHVVPHTASADETHLAWTPQVRHELAAKTRTFLERGETEIRITLDPPELGKLSIKLEIGPGRVAAHLVATNAHAAALLDRDRSDLVRAFEAQGIDDVSVHVGAERSSQEDSQAPARRSPHDAFDPSIPSRTDEPSRARRARRSAVDLVA
jgi:flagellar hook-length control protein FliK